MLFSGSSMSEQIFIQGPVGKIELFVDRP
ncbi:UNVERIFIED_CONTAM: hydrolase, partial [Cronobacter sakazakii]